MSFRWHPRYGKLPLIHDYAERLKPGDLCPPLIGYPFDMRRR